MWEVTSPALARFYFSHPTIVRTLHNDIHRQTSLTPQRLRPLASAFQPSILRSNSGVAAGSTATAHSFKSPLDFTYIGTRHTQSTLHAGSRIKPKRQLSTDLRTHHCRPSRTSSRKTASPLQLYVLFIRARLPVSSSRTNLHNSNPTRAALKNCASVLRVRDCPDSNNPTQSRTRLRYATSTFNWE